MGAGLLDKLNRARVMEEEMAGMLVDLCDIESLPGDLPAQARGRIKGLLTGGCPAGLIRCAIRKSYRK